jgi:hypothetical protein
MVTHQKRVINEFGRKEWAYEKVISLDTVIIRKKDGDHLPGKSNAKYRRRGFKCKEKSADSW